MDYHEEHPPITDWEAQVRADLQEDVECYEQADTTCPDVGALNIFRSTQESFLSSIRRVREGQRVQLNVLKGQLNSLREARHELYAALFQMENNLEVGGTDVHHLPRVLSELERLKVCPMTIEMLRNKEQTEVYHKVKNYTPDTVTVELDDNGDPFVNIIDYTVSVKPVDIIEKKTEKYKPLLDFYSDFQPNLTVACLSPSSGHQRIEQLGRNVEWITPRISRDLMTVFRQSIDMVRELLVHIPLEERAEIQEYLNSQMRSTERTQFDSSLPFGMTVEEFLENRDSREGFLWHLDSLDEHERNMFVSCLYHESKGDAGKQEFLERVQEFCPGSVILDHFEYDRILETEKKQILQESMEYKSKSPPTAPTREVIDRALKEHDEMTKERFEIIDKTRLVHHIPFHFRAPANSEERKHALKKIARQSVTDGSFRYAKDENELEEDLRIGVEEGVALEKLTDLEITERLEQKFMDICSELEVEKEDKLNVKRSRYKAALKALELVSKTNSDIEVLKDIFASGALGDADYEGFVKGELKMARDHKTGEYKVSKVQKHPSSAVKATSPKVAGPTLTPDDIAYHDWAKKRDCHSVSQKKGEVIVVRPSGTAAARSFMEKAGIGKRQAKKKSGEKRSVSKPVSLDLSNPAERMKVSLEYLSHSVELVNACSRVGSLIPKGQEEIMLKSRMENTKLFGEMANSAKEASAGIPSSSLEASSSSESSSDLTGSPRSFPAPRAPPPKSGVCKQSLESFGEDSVRGKSGKDALEEVWRGLCHFGRTHQLFYENLSYVSQMASAGYRIVGSNNPGQFLITFPTESLMKGLSTVPYVVMSIVLPGDIYFNPTDSNEQIFKLKCGGEIHLTMGRRVSRDQLTGHLSAYPRFMIAAEILDHYRSESDMGPLNPVDVVNAYQFVHCININTSSLMDNMRYMVEVCMGMLSYVDQFIQDKLMVPAKTELHMFLYVRMRELLANINQSMDTVRMKVPSIDSEGTVDISTLRIVDGAFESYLFSGHYRKPDHLLMELITLYFCTSKGLHGKHHNLVEIHKTPLAIQEELNNFLATEFVQHPVSKRMQYSPVVIRAATRAAELATNATTDEVRLRFARRENPGGHPASVPTLSSTSSTLVDSTLSRDDEIPEDTPLDHVSPKKSNPSDLADAISEIQAFEERLHSIKSDFQKRKQWKRVKKRVNKIMGMKESERNSLTDSLCLDTRAGMLLRKTESNRQKIRQQLKGMLDDEWRKESMSNGANLPRGDFATRWRERFEFWDSGVVFTEVLRYSEKRLKAAKSSTISGMAKEHVRKVGKMRVAIRPKGQRTQKDREIFVIDLLTKTAIYLLEHMYKQICTTIQAEKISMPGDSKVIDMYTQTKAELTWCKRTMEAFARTREELEGLSMPKNVYCLHHNIDMTKWAPKDNLQKFNWVISMSNFFTLEEKLYYISVLDIMWSKEIYLDDDIMLESMKSVLSGDFEAEDCLFYRMTDGYKSNMVKVRQTWLQGQLNYLSSFVHVGAMKLYEEVMHQLFPMGNCMVNTNVHSDDNETTLCCATDLSAEEVAQKSWSVIEYFCQNVCIELSRKKSSISMQCKQFISIYNIGGEQIHPWVKSAMTVVSGLPYLTISDDISSAWSKIAEAGSKGAPKKVLRLCHEVTRTHVLDVHGILDRKSGRNRFGMALGIEDENLPVMLGGCHIRDWASFIVCGPKSIDKGNMMNSLKKLTQAKADIEPQTVPRLEHRTGEVRTRHENTEMPGLLRSLKLFMVADMMCYDQADDEEESSACKGMNFFRPCKFKTRRTGSRTPFEGITRDMLAELAGEYKAENPCLMLKKPVSQDDLRKYCISQYADPKFQDSLAGQSQNMLLLGLIQARHKPRFRLLSTGSANKEKTDRRDKRVLVREDDIEGKIASGAPITFEEVCTLLNERLSQVQIGLSDAKMLWRRYIANDPEFKCVQFALENCTTTTSYRKLNLVPSKKPDFSQYSELVNNISDLLAFFCESDYCKRNGFGLHSPKSAPKDWSEMCKMFPRETTCLKIRASREPRRMENLIAVLKTIEENKILEDSKEAMKEHEELVKAQSLTSGQKIEMTIAEKARQRARIAERVKWSEAIFEKDSWEKDEFELRLLSESLPVPEWLKFREDEKTYFEEATEGLPRDLVRMSRTFKGRTARVLFTPPTHTDDILEMSLQLRSSIESSGEYQLRMFLNSNLTSSRTRQMLTDNPQSIQWNYRAADALSHLYEACRVLGASENQIKQVLKDSLFCGKPIMEVKAKFPKLPTEYQHRIIVPLYVHQPTYARLMVENMGPYLKEWKLKQDFYGRGEFLCEVKGSGFSLTASGEDVTIKRLTISYTGSLPLGPLNMAMSDLARDIKNAGYKTRKHRVTLNSILITKPVQEGTEEPFLLDVSRNRLAYWRDRTNYLAISGLHVERIQGQLERDIFVEGTTPTLNGIICKDSLVESVILHRLAKNPEYSLLSVPSYSINGLDISSVIAMPGAIHLVKRKPENINLHSLLKCTTQPGAYTAMYASMQSKIVYKLLVPGFEDIWLDSKDGRAATFDRVMWYIRQSSRARQKLKYCAEVLQDLVQKRLERELPYRSDTEDTDAEAYPEFMEDMTQEDRDEYLADLREDREKKSILKREDPELDQKILRFEKIIHATKMPKEDFAIPPLLRERSEEIMTRLQFFEDINTQMLLRRVEKAEDLLSFCKRRNPGGLIELAKSPIDIIRKIPPKDLQEKNLARRKEKEKGVPLKPSEVFTSCSFNPLNPEEVTLASLILGILSYCFDEKKPVMKISLKKSWREMDPRSRDITLALVEELAAVIDTRVFYECPYIIDKGRSSDVEPWEMTLDNALRSVASLSRSSKIRYRSNFKFVETLIATLKNDMKSASEKKGSLVRKVNPHVSRAASRFNSRMAAASAMGMDEQSTLEHALLGAQLTGASTTETSEDDMRGNPCVTSAACASIVSLGSRSSKSRSKSASSEGSGSGIENVFSCSDLDSDDDKQLGHDAFELM